MKPIKQYFSLNAWFLSPVVDLGGGAEAKIILFMQYGHIAYQIKGNDTCRNMVAQTHPQPKHIFS